MAFEAEGKTFLTAEHYFAQKKALHFQDSDTAKLIMATSDPEKAKQLSQCKAFRKVSGIVFQVNTCFKQCS